VNILDNYSINC